MLLGELVLQAAYVCALRRKLDRRRGLEHVCDGLFRLAQRVLRRTGDRRRVQMRDVQQLLLDVARRIRAQHVHRHPGRFGVAQSLWLAAIVVAHGQHHVGLLLIADDLSRQPQAADLRLEPRPVHAKRIDAHRLAPIAEGGARLYWRRAAIDGRRRAALLEPQLVGNAAAARPTASGWAERWTVRVWQRHRARAMTCA